MVAGKLPPAFYYFVECKATLFPSVSTNCAIKPFVPIEVLGNKILPPACSIFERGKRVITGLMPITFVQL